MMTRDSQLWLVAIAAAVLTYLGAHFDLLREAFGVGARTQAAVELLAGLAGVVAGVMRMSPLPISDAGRADAIQKKVASAETASVAAAVAANAADTAAKASNVAVEMAKVASTESTKAADTLDE